MSDLGERVPVLIYDGINVIADDRIPEGYIGVDMPDGLALIKIDVTLIPDAIEQEAGDATIIRAEQQEG